MPPILPLLFLKAVRRGDTLTSDMFAAPLPGTFERSITRKDGVVQTYHVKPEAAPKPKPAAKVAPPAKQPVAAPVAPQPAPKPAPQPTPADRTAQLDDHEDLADEMLRDPHSAKAKELMARIVGNHREILGSSEPAPAPQEHRYALVNRPAGLGAVPKEGMVRVEPRPEKGQDHYDMARHGFVVYDRELTANEQQDFELAPALDGEARAAVAAQLAMNLPPRYVEKSIEMAAKNPGYWAQTVASQLGKLYDRRHVSVGDFDAFTAQVLDRLKARQAAREAPAKAPEPEEEVVDVRAKDAQHQQAVLDTLVTAHGWQADKAGTVSKTFQNVRPLGQAGVTAGTWSVDVKGPFANILRGWDTQDRILLANNLAPAALAKQIDQAVAARVDQERRERGVVAPEFHGEPPATEAEAMAAIERAKREREGAAPVPSDPLTDWEHEDMADWVRSGKPDQFLHKLKADKWQGLSADQQDSIARRAEQKTQQIARMDQDLREAKTANDAAVAQVRAGNPVTPAILPTLRMPATLTDYGAASLFQRIAGGTWADAERAIRNGALRVGTTEQGYGLRDSFKVVLKAQQQVKNYGVLPEKTRLVTRQPAPKPEGQDDLFKAQRAP